MRRYLRVYRVLIAKYTKSLMQSKSDFFMGLFGFIASQISGIIFIYLIFNAIPHLKGWSLYEIVFIYGFSQLPRGIDHILADNIWLLSDKYIKDGSFDRYLLRPVNPLFNMVAERFQPDGFGELAIGFTLIGISMLHLNIIISPVFVLFFIISVLAGTVIYTSVKLFFASFAFWIKDSMSLLNFVYTFTEVSKYPVEIYSAPIKFTVSFIIPFAFVAYYPAAYFLGRISFFSGIGLEIIVAIIAWIVSYTLFKLGIKAYESVGN